MRALVSFLITDGRDWHLKSATYAATSARRIAGANPAPTTKRGNSRMNDRPEGRSATYHFQASVTALGRSWRKRSSIVPKPIDFILYLYEYRSYSEESRWAAGNWTNRSRAPRVCSWPWEPRRGRFMDTASRRLTVRSTSQLDQSSRPEIISRIRRAETRPQAHGAATSGSARPAYRRCQGRRSRE
jgi:hypothetical protein